MVGRLVDFAFLFFLVCEIREAWRLLAARCPGEEDGRKLGRKEERRASWPRREGIYWDLFRL
jgi:hypothetical protein